MTKEEKVENFIKIIFEPVEDKPGYVWFNKRDSRIISVETLRKTLCNKYEAESEKTE